MKSSSNKEICPSEILELGTAIRAGLKYFRAYDEQVEVHNQDGKYRSPITVVFQEAYEIICRLEDR